MQPGSSFGPGSVSDRSAVVASDKTSARVCGKTWWQWLFASSLAVYHTIVSTRGKALPVEFLGAAKPKVLISDRLPALCRHDFTVPAV